MDIGTPLTANATRVMVLGAGELGKELTIAFQRFGVEVTAVDRYANAPGHQVAHHARVIDMADGNAVRELVAAERPHIIVPEIEAIATDALAEIEEEGLAEIIPNARTVQLTMSREGIRRLAADTLGLPTSRYAFADSVNGLKVAIDGGVGYPCLVKPIMSSSGKGQSLVEDPDQVEQAWEKASEDARVASGRVIVEEKIDFDMELTLLTVRTLGQGGVIDTFFCEPIGHRQEAGDYVESWQPQQLSEKAWWHAREVAAAVTASLGGRGVFGVELFVKGDRVWFSEVSPRPHDTGMVTMASQRLDEFALHARAVLGLPVSTELRRPAASAVIYGGANAEGVVFTGAEDALQVPDSELRLFGKPQAYTRRRMGVALANGDNVKEARQRAKETASHIKPVAR